MNGELVLAEIKNPLVIFSTPNGLDSVIDKIEAEVKTIDRDISTEKGRDNVRSIAFKLAKSKTALDKMGKELTEEQRAIVTAVNAERKRAWERMEALQEEIRKPLTDWEDAEKNRVAAHEISLSAISALDVWENVEITSGLVKNRIAALPALLERDWQEFAARSVLVSETTLAGLNVKLAAVEKREHEAAELERLRAAEQARLQAEREASIAAQAKAGAEKKAKEEAATLAEKVRLESEAAAKREQEAKEKAEKAESDRIAAEKKAEEDKIVAAKKAESEKATAIEAAAKAERDKLAAQQETERLAADAREKDKTHKAKINNAALAPVLALIQAVQADDLTAEEGAKKLIGMIAKGEIPNVKIIY